MRAGVLAAVVSVGCLAPTSADAATTTSTWTQPQADAAQSNHARGETVLTSATVPELTPSYSLAGLPRFSECGGGLQAPVANGSTIFYGDGKYVNAVRLSTGARRWRQLVDTGVGETLLTSLAVAANTLVMGELTECYSASDPDGALLARDTTTGALRWSIRMDPAVTGAVVSGSRVFDTAEDAASQVVEARALSTGRLLWQQPDCYGVFVVGTTAVTGCGAFDAATGALRWRKPSGWHFWRGDGPGVSTPQIYATDAAGRLTALRAGGARVWTSSTESGPVLAAGPARIYVTCDTDALCALSRTTGKRLWKAPVNPRAVAVAADVVYPSPGYPLDADTGAALPEYYVNPLYDAHAAQVSNGHLLVEVGRSLDVYTPAR
ncbi:MAG: outer membrane protein assembly factor BamB family protein [Angustibacter sp.]